MATFRGNYSVPKTHQEYPVSEKVHQSFSARFTKGQRWHVRFQPRGSQPLQQHPFQTVMRWLDNNLFSDTSRSVCGGAGEEAAGGLGVVTGRHQQVGEHEQLIVGEALPVLLPVIVVSAPELGQRLFHRHLWAKQKKYNQVRQSRCWKSTSGCDGLSQLLATAPHLVDSYRRPTLTASSLIQASNCVWGHICINI